ncbi:unnamed protein product, partial [Discosporangium mesarthrocarpum]
WQAGVDVSSLDNQMPRFGLRNRSRSGSSASQAMMRPSNWKSLMPRWSVNGRLDRDLGGLGSQQSFDMAGRGGDPSRIFEEAGLLVKEKGEELIWSRFHRNRRLNDLHHSIGPRVLGAGTVVAQNNSWPSTKQHLPTVLDNEQEGEEDEADPSGALQRVGSTRAVTVAGAEARLSQRDSGAGSLDGIEEALRMGFKAAKRPSPDPILIPNPDTVLETNAGVGEEREGENRAGS